jgi:hypothetical protein
MKVIAERPNTPIQPGSPASKPEGAAAKPKPAAENSDGQSFAKVFRGVGRELDRGERMMEGIRTQKASSLDGQELLALQVEVYRYNEVVDLSAKLVDRTTQGVKSVLTSGQG